MSSNYIFSLDIGTRSVVGVVLTEGPRGLEITACEQLEHQTRAMIDGQIHDIEQVSKVLMHVKDKLEAKVGHPLYQVSVAAAGRALKTVRVKVNSDVTHNREVQKEDVLRLEMQAVQKAQKILADSKEEEDEQGLMDYHCVGYSIVQYELDSHKIGNLYSQRGKSMSAEVIATFLPRVVVDSMSAALTKAGLEMASLTLEPIAASTVVVPPSMRQLNIALVDIGAGTSDIAVTSDGSVIGYGMAPVAGDEVTEKISSHFLVDFNEAEKIKKTVYNIDEIRFTDVLGVEHTVAKQEILDVISEAVQSLTKMISEKILELNGKTPQAVICIGGGSLTPLLKDMLAESLGLSKQRVAVRGREAIAEVFGAQELVGPEAVTPIGIAVTSYERKGLGFARIEVNGTQVKLFEANRSTVADALVAAGISMRRTQPRLGLALTVTVNGDLKIVKGGKGQPSVIMLNGNSTSLDTPVQHNDYIEFTEAVDGENARGFIYDVVPDLLPVNVNINGKTTMLNPVITMNDRSVNYYDEITNNAKITYQVPKTVGEIMKISGFDLPETEYVVYVNERIAAFDTALEEGDDIIVELADVSLEGPDIDLEVQNADMEAMEVQTESEAITGTFGFASEAVKSKEELVPKDYTTVYVNDETIIIDRRDIILADILTRTSFSLKPPESSMRLEMKVNGAGAEFTTPLNHGDKITLDWIK